MSHNVSKLHDILLFSWRTKLIYFNNTLVPTMLDEVILKIYISASFNWKTKTIGLKNNTNASLMLILKRIV